MVFVVKLFRVSLLSADYWLYVVSLSVVFVVSWFSGVVVGCLLLIANFECWLLIVGNLCRRILLFHGFLVSSSGVGC